MAGGRSLRGPIGLPLLLLLGLAVVAGWIGPSAVYASPPTSAIRYVYDADGQLKAVIEPASETAIYSWDPAGNLLSIARHSSSALSIIELAPAQGAVGETVTISGTGFSTAPSADTVKFNGTKATVSVATAVSLTVTVPTGAASGTVSVQTEAEGPVTSVQSFTVASSSAPTITSLSTTLAAVGSEVTISGSNFEPNAYDSFVTVNRSRPELISESSSSIKFKIPEAVDSGHVSVATPQGSVTGPDLYIPPNGISTSKIGVNERFSVGGSLTVKLEKSAENVGLGIFEGAAGERVSLVLSESTIESGKVSVWGPGGDKLSGSETSFSKSSGGFVGPVTLPSTGTYTVLFEPKGSYTGKIKLTAYEVPANSAASIVPTVSGASETVTTTVPGQEGEVTFKGTEGERIFLESPEVKYGSGCCNVQVSLETPEGEELADMYMESGSYIDTQTLPSAGTYKIHVKPKGIATGSIKLTAYEVPTNFSASITPSEGGVSQVVKTTVPGQNGEVTFKGTAGERIFLNSSEWGYGSGCCNVKVSIRTPEETTLAGRYLNSTASESYIDTQTLPSTGTYTLYVDPVGAATGSIKLTAYEVPTNFSASITPSEGGVSQVVKTTVPGQNGEVTFKGTVGERIFLNSSESSYGSCCSLKVSLRTPEETTLTTEYLYSSHPDIDTQTLPSTGTYTLYVDPVGAATGSIKLTVYEVPENALGSITIGGAAVKISTTVPGQNAYVTFSGKASEGIKLTMSEVKIGTSSCCSAQISIEKPEGGNLVSPKDVGTSGGTITSTLTVAGTYKIYINPLEASTGSIKLTLVDPPAREVVASVPWEKRPFADPDLYPFSERPLGDAGLRSTVSDLGEDRGTGTTDSGSRTGEPSMTGREHEVTKGTEISPETRAFRPGGPSSWTPPASSHEGKAWVTGEPPSPWTKVPQLRGVYGTTALAGQVLAQNGLPLAGVRVSLVGTYLAARTDEAGRFLLSGGVPAGHKVLVVEGEERAGHRRYGTYEIGVNLTAHRTTILPYTIWLTSLNPTGDHRIPSPARRETILTTPQIPGLEVRLPAGSVITDATGHTVHNLNITAIPVDRPPFALPPFVEVPVYFTVQPGRAYLSKGAKIIYPNWGHLPPGQRVDFWNYDASDRGWYVYGKGTVTPNGQQVIPDPNVRVWEFTGAMISSSPPPPPTSPNGGATGGEPVDLGTGLFVYHKTDLVLPDTIPIVIERTYRQGDSNSYSFGTGMTNLYDMRLWSENNYYEADLILPDGGRVHYVRTSPGGGIGNAEYEATGSPGLFYASTLKINASEPGWDLTLTNGLTYEFPEEAPLRSIRDRFGNRLTITRENGTLGNITQITSPHGLWAKFTYDSSHRVTEITDNGGRHLKYTYNSAGLLEKATDATGRTTSYEYNATKQMTSVTDGRGKKYIENEYEAHGRVSKQSLADGGIYGFAYTESESGQVTSTTVTDPRKLERRVIFNSKGFPTSETDALGTGIEETTDYERQAETGLILSMTDPLGRKTAYTYDSSGNITKRTLLEGTSSARTTEYNYVPGTNELASSTDALKHTITYRYGKDGELLSETDPLGHKTSFEYNGEGEPIASTNALGKTTKLGYEFGNLTSVTDPLGRTTRRFVDALGRLASATNPSGNRTLYEYNADNELTKMTDPLGAATSYEYNGDGDIFSTTDPDKHTTSRTYDPMDRLESETDPLEHTTKAIYDQDGNLIELVDPRGKVAKFSYDALNRLTEAWYGVSAETAEETIKYNFDSGNRLTKVVDSASGTYTPEYNEFDNLKSLATPNGTISYGYDEDDLRTSMTVPGQEAVKYTYDEASRLTELKRGSGAVAFAYDAANRPTSTTLPGGIEEQYGYDEANEPTSIIYKKGSEKLGELDYSYEPDGRKEAVWGSYARTGLPEAISSASYNADNEQTERNGKKLTYDADGNLISDGTNEYKWNARDQLAEISGGATASFVYDPFGRRIEKTIGGNTAKVLFDGPNAVQENQGSATTNLLTGLAIDKTYVRTTSKGTENLLTDALGSTIALASESGKVETTYTYDPFGATTQEGAGSENPFQYAGRENDGDGLYYNRARYLNPAAPGFISPDPLGSIVKQTRNSKGSHTLTVAQHPFNYADNDPINYRDPFGFEAGPVQERAEEYNGAGETSDAASAIADAAGFPEIGAPTDASGGFMKAEGDITEALAPTYDKIIEALKRGCSEGES
jgi:RHS repeat-associated protein